MILEPLLEVDEGDEVVVALRVGLADKINSLHNADLLQAELLGNEVLAGLLILGIRGVVGITRQRAGVAAGDVEGHLIVERVGRHVVGLKLFAGSVVCGC